MFEELINYNFSDKPVLIKQVFGDLPSWEDIIMDLDHNAKANNRINFLENCGLVTYFGENISKVERIRKLIHRIRPNEKICTAHIYISLLSISNTFGWHNDNTDVFYIQALGETIWEVEYNSEKFSHKLIPGDLIYVPKFIMHNTIPKTPRVGISIGFT